MDQKGSRYVDDLQALENQGVLVPGAIVVADNVLKPGAPLFLWWVVKSGVYNTELLYDEQTTGRFSAISQHREVGEVT